MKQVNVEVWSDFVCPWCWIAKRRFEKAAWSLKGRVEISVVPRAYRLAKDVAPTDFEQVLRRKFGNVAAAEQMMAAVAEHGAAEGLTYNFDTMRFGDTSDVHALVKSIREPEDRLRIIDRIYQAATTDGIDIFDRDVLGSLARKIGIPEASFDFDSPEIASQIANDELMANRFANGVPLFVFNDKFHLSGARDIAVFEKVLIEAAIEVAEPAEDMTAASCVINGCAI